MVDLIRKGVESLRKFQKKNLTELVQYVVPGEGTLVDVPMTIGGEESKETDVGIFIDSRSQDFLVDPNDLVDPTGVINLGALIQPVRGHQIIRTITDIDGNPTQNITYDVMPADGESPARQSSRYHLNIRIHTKRSAFSVKAVP